MRKAAAVIMVLSLAGFVAYVRHRSHFKSTLVTPRAAAPSTDIFPVSEGTYWIYRGVVHYYDRGNDHAQAKVTWKMEATRTVRRGNVVAAIVKGFPGDLDWSIGDATPQNSIIVIRDSKFYTIIPSAAEDTLKRLDDPNDSLENLATDDGCPFRSPLVHGDKCGPPESVSREDGMYCWIVDGPERMSLSGIAGLPREIPQEVDSYSLAYRTLPDDTKIDFVPGVGIVAYAYHHHGTVADTEMKLLEFHRSEGNPPTASTKPTPKSYEWNGKTQTWLNSRP